MNQPFRQRRRQQFITEGFAKHQIERRQRMAAALAAELVAEKGNHEALSLLSASAADNSFEHWLLGYTAGEPLERLRSDLTGVIEAYERYQVALEAYEQIPRVSPLGLDQLGDYERAMQIMGLCILLHRPDLLGRIAALIDPGYKGEDTLYEDLMAFYQSDRVELDEWYHEEPYTPLVRSMYEHDKPLAAQMLNDYVQSWYPAFKQTPWHDGHLRIDGDEGDYFGYWAFEAGAVAYLLELDDASINHMVYPKDLVAFARAYRDNAAPDTRPPRTPAGEPCPKEGYWFTPAHSDSRRHFKQGEVMPDFKNPLWTTLWQWDENQKGPKGA